MHDYTAYGLTIHSEIPLPELVAAPASDSTPALRSQGHRIVHIRRGAVDRRRPAPFAANSPTWATAERAFVEYAGCAAFHIAGGQEITVDASPRASAEVLRLYLLGPALALLLHQRNFLVLHASAVTIHGGAIAFVGEKGMGKSTMAAAFHARGHALVADDLVAIDMSAPHPLAYPGFPQLKLFPESAALLEIDPAVLPKVHPNLEKRARRAVSGFPTEPLPLRQLFVLEDASREGIAAMPAGRAFMELVRHSYLLGFLRATHSAAAHFRQATALAAKVPVSRLLRRRDLGALPSVARLVEGEIERAA